MTARKHRGYTLWMKFRNTDWVPQFTVKQVRPSGTNPRKVIDNWMYPYTQNDWWKNGKNWMIKPEGQKPAELEREI